MQVRNEKLIDKIYRLILSNFSFLLLGFSTAEKTWLPVHPNYKNLNLKQQMSGKSHYSVYKSLVKLRKMAALCKGRFHAEVLNRDVFAFER